MTLDLFWHRVKQILGSLKLVTHGTQGAQAIAAIDFSPLLNYKLRQKSIQFSDLETHFGIKLTQGSLTKQSLEPWLHVSANERRSFLKKLEKDCDFFACENLDATAFWGESVIAHAPPSGFNDKAPDSRTTELLATLYDNRFMAKEKKNLILDLERSTGPYLVGTGEKPSYIIDAASQIATLAQGYNHPKKNAMQLRSELWDPYFIEHDLFKNWDVRTSYENLLKAHSGLKQVRFLNSGSEAIEAAFLSCQQKHPKRRKIISFEGSFHGRTLLSLHATHSPAKREPFEIFKGLVEFLPFPENKTPAEQPSIPDNWHAVWASPQTATLDAGHPSDPLLLAELKTLLKIRDSIMAEPPLAVLIEPMQCEGGERYGSNRFFQALRLLTRALDTPLIFDEVQTGFGLGGSFFWANQFGLKHANGSPDHPDCIVSAKKAQLGVCLSDYPIPTTFESSPASLYRGYLQALEILEAPLSKIETLIAKYLKQLQKHLPDYVFYPRNQGLCFAFDLASPEILNALVDARFPSGLLFYPAGDRTARFRVLADANEGMIAQIFFAIYRCFLKLEESKKIGPIQTLAAFSTWAPDLEILYRRFQDPNTSSTIRFTTFSTHSRLPLTIESFLKTTQEEWCQHFSSLVKQFPELLVSKNHFHLLTDPVTAQSLLQDYQQGNLSWLDLLWRASRSLGHHIMRLTQADTRALSHEISDLQKRTYEEARRDKPETFIKLLENNRGVFLAAFNPQKKLVGMCAAEPLGLASHVAIVKDDPLLHHPSAYYSVDLTVDETMRERGLGFRLKCEQIMAVSQMGGSLIRSRNRSPESQAMIDMNRKLGAVTIAQNSNDYEGSGLALYQSLQIASRNALVHDLRKPALKNKSTLSNFVSYDYIHNIEILRELLPAQLRHVFLASGKGEALDKAIKLLIAKRPKATVALSITGDSFAETNATGRSLGGTNSTPFFNWPTLSLQDALTQSIEQPDRILGLFVEPLSQQGKKDHATLLKLMKRMRELNIPIVFHESRSAFFKYDKHHFLASSMFKETPPDIIYFYGGGQLGVTACLDSYFLEKPLTLISTWDGDEHSLNLFSDRVFQCDF